jgi:hypothetical protein
MAGNPLLRATFRPSGEPGCGKQRRPYSARRVVNETCRHIRWHSPACRPRYFHSATPATAACTDKADSLSCSRISFSKLMESMKNLQAQLGY